MAPANSLKSAPPGWNNKVVAVSVLLSVGALLVLSSFVLSLPQSFALSLGPQYFKGASCSPPSCRSTNWSGYAVSATSGSVGDVKGSWRVPTLSCPISGTAYVALWVGIDGLPPSTTVEQTGILGHCTGGLASYFAWYEFYPNPTVAIPTINVRPGDLVVAEVSYSSSTGLFTTTITDGSSSFNISAAVSGALRSSAEWVVERPVYCSVTCKVTTLANFGTTFFGQDYSTSISTNYASVSGVSGPISSFGGEVVAITMTTSRSKHAGLLASPSPLTSDGTSFTVAYQ